MVYKTISLSLHHIGCFLTISGIEKLHHFSCGFQVVFWQYRVLRNWFAALFVLFPLSFDIFLSNIAQLYGVSRSQIDTVIWTLLFLKFLPKICQKSNVRNLYTRSSLQPAHCYSNWRVLYLILNSVLWISSFSLFKTCTYNKNSYLKHALTIKTLI